MSASIITCPHCHKEIELSQAFSHQLEAQYKSKFEQDKQAWEKEKEQLQKDQTRQTEVIKKEMWEKAKVAATDKNKQELTTLKLELQDRDKELDEKRKAELELRREKRKLEDERKELELTVEKKLDTERKQIQEDVAKQIREENKLKNMEREKQLEDARRVNEDLRRKLEQGSQQMQGEVLELELEEMLRTEFVYDEIREVPKGVRGADVLQIVRDRSGRKCGTIVWESKRTKAWTDTWITKLKEDQRAVKAELAVIVSNVLPKDIKYFGVKDTVWISSYEIVLAVSTTLRSSLIKVAAAQQAQVGKNEKTELLYQYLTGIEFKQRVEGIVESFIQMKDDLEREKRAFTKMWAKREKQIEQVVHNTLGMHGDLQGFMGASLPEIRDLELPSGEDVDEGKLV
ncbi:DUF2130 domain-containing protein [Candidatus Roizmanbacteria bacterium CG10_big_fil_rev_8_21_14_0_10_39_6]|uniref:DUF2130 domain-containing protein n=1 Tax=Candidatus Roizmanbacteria bacterium CG10_big_fil_rev_8_21_14_0_10_39_6 TaxID=1974853 RepID=A0A2M8KS29_9BACT|nr:MAG: DUF2130 domain-containing protein [Candidatus Roizmanbacteria bacterium CG10_big_fil_rev_8_21_14_0_10_39_6]